MRSISDPAQINELYRIGQATLAGPAGNGNIVNDDTRRFVYDAFNRVKEVYKEYGTSGEFTVKIAEYTYDALGRRIRKAITSTGLPGDLSNITVNYLYDGVQCIEERDGANNPKRQYIWGHYVDELIQQREINGGNTDYYLLSDLLYRAVALTEDDGSIYEAYDCDAYGNTIAYSGPGVDTLWFTDDDVPTSNPTCQFIFTGRRFDPETSNADTQMYFYRARYYSPVLGRFISRDPIGLENATVEFMDKIDNAMYPKLPSYSYGRDARSKVVRVDPTIFLDLIRAGKVGEWTRFLQDSTRSSCKGDQTAAEEVHDQYRNGMNLYQYVLGNPSNQTDPSGLIAAGISVRSFYGCVVPGGAPPGYIAFRICAGSCVCRGCTMTPSSTVAYVTIVVLAIEGCCGPVCARIPSKRYLSVAMMACVQQTVRLIYGPGVICYC